MQGGYAGKYDRYSFLKGGKKNPPTFLTSNTTHFNKIAQA